MGSGSWQNLGMTTNDKDIVLDTPSQIDTYAFLMLRRAVIFRIRTGGSLLRNKEALMARNYGWSARKTFSVRLLEELNKVGEEVGIPAARP